MAELLHSDDREIEVDCERAAQAYFSFECEGKRAEEFSKQIQAHADALGYAPRAPRPTNPYLLCSSSTASEWRRTGGVAQRPFSVALAVYHMLDIDITCEKLFEGLPVDFTQFCTLGPVSVELTSNQPDDEEQEIYRLAIRELSVSIAKTELRASHLAEIPSAKDHTLGTLHYGARELSIRVRLNNGSVSAPIRLLREDTDSPEGRTTGAILQRRVDRPGIWRLYQRSLDALVADLEIRHLCLISAKSNARIDFEVELKPEDLHLTFGLADRPPADARERARWKMIAQVFHLKDSEALRRTRSGQTVIVSKHKIDIK